LFITFWLTGATRLRHVAYLEEDPLVQRMCGLTSLPCYRTLGRWLEKFTVRASEALLRVNQDLVAEKIKALRLKRITLDFDGTVLTTGYTVQGAARGYNPHARFAPSYYPFLCHIAQTGHFFFVKNRPGNVHDSKNALAMIRQCVEQIREILPGVVVEMRLDSAFFQRDILRWLDRHCIEYAVKMPLWKWTGIKDKINDLGYWYHYGKDICARPLSLDLRAWDRSQPIILIRHKVSDKKDGKKYTQLDLFTPDDGIYEYEAIATNKRLRPDHLWHFYNGRAAMERQIAELKGDFGFDVIPSRDYRANSAYQQISLLAYNLIRNFQIDAGLAEARESSINRNSVFEFKTLRSLRFEVIHAAGRIVNTGGIKRLRLCSNAQREQQYRSIEDHLAKMAA
jgi:hypothetical protein